MKSALQSVCHRISEAFTELLKTSFPVNSREPRLPPLLGQCVVFPQLIKLIPAGFRVDEKELWGRAKIQDGLPEALLGQNPIQSVYVEEFTGVAMNLGLRDALEQRDRHHPIVTSLGEDFCRLTIQACLANGYVGRSAADPKEHATLLAKLRKYRRVLESPFCTGESFRERRTSAIANLPEDRRTCYRTVNGEEKKISYFTASDWQAEIIPRSANSWRKEIERRAKVSKTIVKKALRQAEDSEAAEIARIPSRHRVRRQARTEIRGKKPWGNRREAWTVPYPVPVSSGLGAAGLHEILLDICRLDCQARILWAVAAFTFCQLKPERLQSIKIRKQDGVSYVVHRIRPPQLQGDPLLHRLRTGEFLMPMPARLAEAAEPLVGPNFEADNVKNAESWATKNHSQLTSSRLQQALSTIGTHSYGLPTVTVQALYRPGQFTTLGPRSYTALSPTSYPQFESYFQLIDPAYRTPEDPPYSLALSGLTPTLDTVQGFFHEWHECRSAVLPPLASVVELADRWNAIAAGAYQVQILITGLRAYKLPCLFMSACGAGEIHDQKYPFVTSYCEELYQLLFECEIKRREYQQAIVAQGFDIDRRHPAGPSSMMELTEEELVYFEPSARHVAAAYCVSEKLAPFALLHPNAMRHFAATTLRESGGDEMMNRMYLGHEPRSIGGLSVFRLELSTGGSLRAEAQSTMGRKVGLWV